MTTIPEALAVAVKHHQAGQLQAAEEIYRQVLAIEPDQPDALHLLGVVAYQSGRLEAAIEHIGRAIGLKGTDASFHYNLGCAFMAQRKSDETIACCRRALELKPGFADVHNLLGSALKEEGKLGESVACYCRALELNPNYATAQSNLAGVYKDQGKLDEAIACFHRALELNPDYATAHSNFLYTLHYHPGITLPELAAAHAEFDGRHALPLRNTWPRHERLRAGRLRLGFVSADFGQHPVAYFLVRCLENLDRNQFETVCYSDRTIKDHLTARLQAVAATWRDIVGVNHDALAAQIRADRIDILFDLSGHTAGNRLLTFARKPAPVQITWIGYEGTTGLAAMDFLIADRYTVPAGTETYYRERVLRMPDGYVCYDPPACAPEVGPLPAAKNGYIRFGSFNNLAKINSQVIEVWAGILRRVPDSRLMLKYRGLGDASVRERYLGMFAAHGIDRRRLELADWTDYGDYLAAYREVDIALDPFPFGGGITTCDALWMGVPVVTYPGETFAGRHSLSHLSNVGLTETIGDNSSQYVEIAATLACDLPRLAALRATLRDQVAASPLCDGKRFAANFADILRGVWRD